MGKIGEKTGGRRPGTPNKVTQSIRTLLNTILPPEELEKHWRFYLKHRDIEIRFAAFKLAQLYMSAGRRQYRSRRKTRHNSRRNRSSI